MIITVPNSPLLLLFKEPFVWICLPGPDPEITTKSTVPNFSVTSDPGLISTSTVNSEFFNIYIFVNLINSNSPEGLFMKKSLVYVLAPIVQPPVIVSPLNGTIFESPHGK